MANSNDLEVFMLPDMSADIGCLVKLFPAHEERLRGAMPHQAVAIRGSSSRVINLNLMKNAKGSLVIRIAQAGNIGIHLGFFQLRPSFIRALIEAQHTFPNFLEHLSGFELRLHGLTAEDNGMVLVMRFPAGMLPVFFTALVGTKLFQLMRVYYLQMLEAENDR